MGMAETQPWAGDIYEALKAYDVRQVSFVPDGGHTSLLRLIDADEYIKSIALTTEEEGVAQCAGAWLGGERSVLLMQSSGVGNCVNMLSLIKVCRFPLLTLVTMRGEYGEFNPWQVPMGSAVESVLNAMDVTIQRANSPSELPDIMTSAARMAFEGGAAVSVLLSQRLIGAKEFTK